MTAYKNDDLQLII